MNAEALGGRILRAAVQPPTAVEVRWAGRLQGACLLGALGLTLLFSARTLAPAFRAPNMVFRSRTEASLFRPTTAAW